MCFSIIAVVIHLHCFRSTAAVLYYYLYKRTAEYMGDPRLYEDSLWLRDAFARARRWRRGQGMIPKHVKREASSGSASHQDQEPRRTVEKGCADSQPNSGYGGIVKIVVSRWQNCLDAVADIWSSWQKVSSAVGKVTVPWTEVLPHCEILILLTTLSVISRHSPRWLLPAKRRTFTDGSVRSLANALV